MGYGRGKDSKSKKKKRKEESSSSSESDSDKSYSSDSSYSSSDSEPESLKRKRLDSTSSKKQKKKDKKKEKKKKKKEAESKKKEVENKISKDDFYHKSTEFRLWLVEEKSMYFDQIDASKAKKYFKKFVKRWNSHKLAKKFYKGIDVADARSSLTKYKWKFADKIKPVTNTPSPGNFKVPSAWKSTPTNMTPPQRTFSTFGKAGKTGTIGPSLPGQTPINLQKAGYLDFGQSSESIGPSRPMQGPSMPPGSESHGHVEQGPSSSRKGSKRRSNSPGLDADGSYMGIGGENVQNRLAARHRQRDVQKDKAAVKIADYKAREQAKMSKLLELARANKSKDALW